MATFSFVNSTTLCGVVGVASPILGWQKPNTTSMRSVNRVVMVKAAEGTLGSINPEIRKDEAKVVDAVVVDELSKAVTPYCRCWRSGTFPLCDGSHVKHNKATGDNVGPLLLKKQN
ncbi:hypothetical protein ACFE04_028245 [Oxalis oulophora]